VQSVRELVKQVDQASMAVPLPDLSASLAAVHQFKRGG
jgi:uroporphyrinogen III methyltransferase/synthase